MVLLGIPCNITTRSAILMLVSQSRHFGFRESCIDRSVACTENLQVASAMVVTKDKALFWEILRLRFKFVIFLVNVPVSVLI